MQYLYFVLFTPQIWTCPDFEYVTSGHPISKASKNLNPKVFCYTVKCTIVKLSYIFIYLLFYCFFFLFLIMGTCPINPCLVTLLYTSYFKRW